MWRLVLLFLLFSHTAAAQTLTVAAASSYRAVLDAVAQDFEQSTGVIVRTVYGSSGKLATQIQAGAPFDLYFSANAGFMNLLQDKGLVTNVTLDGYGQLALWSAQPRTRNLVADDINQAERVAIAQPRHAPYGQAALAWLQQNNLNLSEQQVYAENVAQAAQMVFSGAAELGLVAVSVIPLSARAETQLMVLDVADKSALQQLHGVVTTTKNRRAAYQFSQYFQRPEFDDLKRRYGLIPAESDTSL